MGLCLSVALWKEKLYADGGRRSVRGRVDEVAGVKGGGYEYGILGGDVPEVEKKVLVAPTAEGVRSGGAEGAAVSGGTPARPIWQRRVLMGVKCQLPRFSGIILYDESGRPVCSGSRDRARDQEKHAAAISVLRDLL
ncbi:hypothetical protein SEVIR_1G143300v4 [Setaria viridis]|uniref:Uncharacterized protein n=2 Tax=Setaria TaxID=4554 RepID=K3YWL2_SETIT|nr:uncharacterized protein LOC101761131 [Setaria italica]XP_034580948.1 uncharacterized protein LOC117844321 [Setaria viridis]RCV06202.1 hypothetical protein SETIT_1G144400v2 [Setaria italica]TKW38879.1 hypothetical protein SEVIR_1G143300v2 [Setaria viridis]